MVASFPGKAWEHSPNRKYVSEAKGRGYRVGGSYGLGRDCIIGRTSVREDIDCATLTC